MDVKEAPGAAPALDVRDQPLDRLRGDACASPMVTTIKKGMAEPLPVPVALFNSAI